MNRRKFTIEGKRMLLAAVATLLTVDLAAQDRQPNGVPETGIYATEQQMASLRPGHGLMWQRTSPTAQQPDGPVLYQLIFSAGGAPGTVPVFAENSTSGPREPQIL